MNHKDFQFNSELGSVYQVFLQNLRIILSHFKAFQGDLRIYPQNSIYSYSLLQNLKIILSRLKVFRGDKGAIFANALLLIAKTANNSFTL